jgi:hypothetical protein
MLAARSFFFRRWTKVWTVLRLRRNCVRYFGRGPALSEKSDHFSLTPTQTLSCRVITFHNDLIWVRKTRPRARASRSRCACVDNDPDSLRRHF